MSPDGVFFEFIFFGISRTFWIGSYMSFASVEKSLASSSVITSGLVSFFPLSTAGFIAYLTTVRKHLTRTVYWGKVYFGSQARRYQSSMVRKVPRNRVVHGMVVRKQRQKTDREHRKGPEQDRPPRHKPSYWLPPYHKPMEGGDPSGAQNLRPHHLWKCLTASPKVDLPWCLLIWSGWPLRSSLATQQVLFQKLTKQRSSVKGTNQCIE